MSEQAFNYKSTSDFSTGTEEEACSSHSSSSTSSQKTFTPNSSSVAGCKRKAGSISATSFSSINRDTDATVELENIIAHNKRFKSLTALVSQQFLCPITHIMMVDPVIAEDEQTYERSAIMTWLENHTTSPMVPSQTIDSSRLLSNRSLRETIEVFVGSGGIEEDLLKEWLDKKNELNLEKARELFRKGEILEAAKLGLPVAQGMVSKLYFLGGIGFQKDYKKALDFALKAAENGDLRGQSALAWMHMYGNGKADVVKDWAVAAKWFGKMACNGPQDELGTRLGQQPLTSMYILGVILQEGGHGLDRDLETAVSWFKKVAETKDYPQVQFWLGECYYLGRGVPKDLSAARSWYVKGATKEDVCAQYELGRMMLKGEGGPQRYLEGAALVGKAAERGFKLAVVALNEMAAFPLSWCKKRAETDGDLITESDLPESYCQVPKDLVAARSWYEKSAAQENAAAQYELGRMMLKGEGGPQSYLEGAALVGKSLGTLRSIGRVYCAVDRLAERCRKSNFKAKLRDVYHPCRPFEVEDSDGNGVVL